MNTIRMMLVDNNPAFVQSIEQMLRCESDIRIAAVAHNGSEALRLALRERPDVLVTDLILPMLDGFALMESLYKVNLGIHVIVLTELTRDCFIRQAMSLGAAYYMVKPIDPAILISRVRDCLHFAEAPPLYTPINERLDRIKPLLKSIGVPPGTAGYRYLHFAIAMAAQMDKLSGRITTEIYPAVARAFHTDQRNVEHAIRHAISSAWSSGGASPAFGRPTNGELIARLAQQYMAKSANP